jgi:hypothetical protein
MLLRLMAHGVDVPVLRQEDGRETQNKNAQGPRTKDKDGLPHECIEHNIIMAHTHHTSVAHAQGRSSLRNITGSVLT